MSVGLKNTDRTRFKKGHVMDLEFLDAAGNPYQYKMTVDNYLGEGSSCICYQVTVKTTPFDPGQKRILKQFYPDPMEIEQAVSMENDPDIFNEKKPDISLEGMRLSIAGYTEAPKEGEPNADRFSNITRLGAGFEEAFRKQSALANTDELYDVVVKPDLCYFKGFTKYVLYEADYGTTLNLKNIVSIEDFLRKMHSLAHALQVLHSHGLIYVDLKPDNILVSGNGNIKLLDFDAVIDTKDLDNVHLSDVRFARAAIDLIAPEIRPKEPGKTGIEVEFEQNKKLFLNNRVDIYSFGAIMLSWFLGRYPTDQDCSSQAFNPEIEKVFNSDKLRRKLTREEQDSLIRIIWGCIQKDISPYGRYVHTEDLVSDLDKLCRQVSVPWEKRKKTFNRIGGRVQAAFVMDKYPLCDYCVIDADNKAVMDVLIIGNDSIGDDFFRNILACAQMLDTRLVIRLAAGGVRDKMNGYLQQWPLFAKTCSIYLEDKKVENADNAVLVRLDKGITSDPFAEVRFYEWSCENNPAEFIAGMDHAETISWILSVDDQIERNCPLAEQISDYMHSQGRRCFIGYLGERGDGYDVEKPSAIHEGIDLCGFNDNTARKEEEKKSQKSISDKAFLLHKFFTREWKERATYEEIWTDFKGDAYNENSSLCSALSIPYKLASLEISGRKEDAARAYWNQVLCRDNPDSGKKMGQMIYLEHRRWMCFMMTEAYDFSGDRYKEYAFIGKNDQRNKVDRLHICIRDCGREGIILDSFTHALWDDKDYVRKAAAKGIALDSLDTMSVEFHQFCSSRIDQMVENRVFEMAFWNLEHELSSKEMLTNDSVVQAFNSLKTIHTRMLDNESDINNSWKKCCRAFEEIITSLKTSSAASALVMNAFDQLVNLSQIIVERNSYHDYKSSDRTILEVIPLLIMSENPIRRIHKPYAKETWQNIASTLIIEPEELFLYKEDPKEEDLEAVKAFLKERGFTTAKEKKQDKKPDIEIKIKDIRELYHLQITDRSKYSVLDITGISGADVFGMAKAEKLDKMPVILFKDGTVHSLNKNTDIDYYSVLKRHITVDENFKLHGAYIHSGERRNYMLGLSGNYKNIWESYIKITPFRYRVLVDVLSKIEKKNYFKIDTDKTGTVQKVGGDNITDRMLRDTGIDQVIKNLQKDGLIEKEVVYPKFDGIGFSLSTKYLDVVDILSKLFRRAHKNPYMHKFYYKKTRRDPFTEQVSEKDMFYIYDDTKIVDIDMIDQVPEGSTDGRKNSAIVGGALDLLLQYSYDTEEGTIISRYDKKKSPVTVDPDKPEQYHIQFLYKNRATKECLMKEGNILEAYVYYSLWKSAFVDDIKLNVAFTWDASDAEEALRVGAITNETDIICTCNMQTFFISCKQAFPMTEHLQEIKYFADYFGMDGKPILVCSNPGTAYADSGIEAKLISSRAEKMGVYYIDRKMIGRSLHEMKYNNLARYLQNIFNGKKDWKDISTK